MNWFSKSATAEVEPPPAAPVKDRKAQIARECEEAGRQLKAAVDAEHAYNIAFPQNPFRFRSEDTLFVQTRVDDPERRRLQSEMRKSIARWNEAWRQRAVFENPQLIL